MTLDLPPGAFHQVTKLYIGRARRFTRPAIEAEVHVLDEVWCHREPPFIDRLDEVDTTTGRVHFCAQGAVGRTLIETEATMDAGRNLLCLRAVEAVESRK